MDLELKSSQESHILKMIDCGQRLRAHVQRPSACAFANPKLYICMVCGSAPCTKTREHAKLGLSGLVERQFEKSDVTHSFEVINAYANSEGNHSFLPR